MASLLAKGWDPKLRNYKGLTPADYALGCSEDVKLSDCKEVRKILGNSTERLTWEQIEVALAGNLVAFKKMVPSEVSANAFD